MIILFTISFLISIFSLNFYNKFIYLFLIFILAFATFAKADCGFDFNAYLRVINYEESSGSFFFDFFIREAVNNLRIPYKYTTIFFPIISFSGLLLIKKNDIPIYFQNIISFTALIYSIFYISLGGLTKQGLSISLYILLITLLSSIFYKIKRSNISLKKYLVNNIFRSTLTLFTIFSSITSHYAYGFGLITFNFIAFQIKNLPSIIFYLFNSFTLNKNSLIKILFLSLSVPVLLLVRNIPRYGNYFTKAYRLYDSDTVGYYLHLIPWSICIITLFLIIKENPEIKNFLEFKFFFMLIFILYFFCIYFDINSNIYGRYSNSALLIFVGILVISGINRSSISQRTDLIIKTSILIQSLLILYRSIGLNIWFENNILCY